MDGACGHRQRDAGAGDHRGLVPALHLARRERLRRSAVVGHAPPVRRSPGAGREGVMRALSDALVLFGATGDLAYKQIFPALYEMTRRGRLKIPVVGLGRQPWTHEQLRARARESIAARGDVDEAVLADLSRRLTYVAGDYREDSVFTALRRALGDSRRPLFYLAIPP